MPFPRANLQDLVGLLAAGIGGTLDDSFGPRQVGYAVMIFDFGDIGSFAYASNALRADMINALEELLTKLKEAPTRGLT